MSKFKLMTEEQKEAIEWLRVQKEFLSDNKRDIFISESGNYPLIVDLLSETSVNSINNRLSGCNLPVIGFEPVEDVADDSTYKLDGWCSSCMYAYPGNAAISGKPESYKDVCTMSEKN